MGKYCDGKVKENTNVKQLKTIIIFNILDESKWKYDTN